MIGAILVTLTNSRLESGDYSIDTINIGKDLGPDFSATDGDREQAPLLQRILCTLNSKTESNRISVGIFGILALTLSFLIKQDFGLLDIFFCAHVTFLKPIAIRQAAQLHRRQ